MQHYKQETISAQQVRNKTLLSLLMLFLFFACCVIAWKWLHKQPESNGTPATLRAVLDNNERVFSAIFSNSHIAKVFPPNAAAPKVRVNGDAGMGNDFDATTWKLQLVRNTGDTIYISIDEIKSLPKTEVIFDFKCIEGWSQVTHWAGVRFSDFVKKYNLDTESRLPYTGINTPDKKYYVGIDNSSMLHPQTILCYEMNGKPLPMNQGYPLRLIIPVKYGIKHIKRIATIFFSSQRPPDYWFERGYDYYAGL
jgi:DMSO/TMAO reductase YedYZ molybdopterin-dependent catalytic subunit